LRTLFNWMYSRGCPYGLTPGEKLFPSHITFGPLISMGGTSAMYSMGVFRRICVIVTRSLRSTVKLLKDLTNLRRGRKTCFLGECVCVRESGCVQESGEAPNLQNPSRAGKNTQRRTRQVGLDSGVHRSVCLMEIQNLSGVTEWRTSVKSSREPFRVWSSPKLNNQPY